MKKNEVIELSFQFALQVNVLCDSIIEERKYVIGNRLLKSGTSIGANVREAQQAESKKDFVHKMKISLKETDKTEYWLLLCQYSSGYPEVTGLLDQVNSLKKMLTAIVLSAQKTT